MQAVPESRQQTFEEIYGPPENFLEIEVKLHSDSLYPTCHASRQAPCHLAKPKVELYLAILSESQNISKIN